LVSKISSVFEVFWVFYLWANFGKHITLGC